MRGLLFYDEVGAKRNEWFIARLIESARARGCELELIITDSDDVKKYDKPNFAIVRTINTSLTRNLEARHIPTFNNSRVSEVANHKYYSYALAVANNIPVMRTVPAKDGVTLPYPFVLKTVDGHGGSEVFMVENEQKYKELLSLFKDRTLIAQELSSEPGVDMRVYVLGGKVLAAVKRTSKSDFRSNFSLGGEVELVDVPKNVKRWVDTFSLLLCPDFVGIDFIRHDGEWVFNEIEDVVGTRMLYSLTDIDAADEYIAYVLSKL